MAPTAGPKETKSLEAVLKNRPDSLLFARLADSYRKDGNIGRAIELCVNGLNNYPYYTTGRILLGRCYLEQQKYGEAIEAFTMVCTTDRRNQMAIKMLADIFVKQGMDERAGGLYSLLLHLDPGNKTLSNLSTKYGSAQGNGDLYSILGIEQTAPAPSGGALQDGNQPFSDSFEPVAQQQFTDHTMVEDRDALFPETPDQEASPFSSGFSIEEQPASDGVSGGDITDRMSALFGESPNVDAPESSMFASGPAVDEQASPVGISGGDIADRMSALFGETPTLDEPRGSPVSSFDDTPGNDFLSNALMPETESSTSDELSGGDISDRIGQLFTDDHTASQPTSPDNVFNMSEEAEPSLRADPLSADSILSGQDFDLSGLTLGNEPVDANGVSSAQEQPDSAIGDSYSHNDSAPTVDDVIELLQPGSELSAPDTTTQPNGAKVSGADVSDRIEEIFSDHDFGSAAPATTTGAVPASDTEFESDMPQGAARFDFDTPESPDTSATPESSSGTVPDFDFSFDTPVTEEAAAPSNGSAPDFSSDLQDSTNNADVVSGTDVSDRIDNLFESIPDTFSKNTFDDELPTNQEPGAVMEDIFPPGTTSEQPREDIHSRSLPQSTEELFVPTESATQSRLPGNDDSLFDPDFSEAEFAETMQFDSALFEQMLNPVDEGASVKSLSPYDTDTADTPSEMVDTAEPAATPVYDMDADHFELTPTGHDEFEDTRDRRIEPDRAFMPETTGLTPDGNNRYDQLAGPEIENDDFQVTTERYRFDGPELVVDNDAPMPSEGTATFEIFRDLDAADTPQLIADAPEEQHESGPMNIADLLSDQPITDRLISDHTEVIDLAPSGEDIAGQIDLLFPSDSLSPMDLPHTSPDIDVPDDIAIGDLLAEETADTPDNDDDDPAYIETMQFSREELAAAISRETGTQEGSDVHTDVFSPPAADQDVAPQLLLTNDELAGNSSAISGEDIKDRLDDIFPGNDLLSLSSDKALLPEDDQEEVMESVSEFYTISGDDASQGASIDLPDTITDVEFTMESEPDISTPTPAYPPPRGIDTAEPETASSADVSDNGMDAGDFELQPGRPIDERDAPFTIPDHVLTPTLADIYFQQGQAHLALRIYERLLRHDPDDEKLSQRMEEIRSAIERDELPTPLNETTKITLPHPKRTTSRTSRKKQVAGDDVKPLPLAGIHLKKQVKNAAKNARKRKH